MKDLIIIGASGHGKVLESIAIIMNQWRKIFFLDDDVKKKDNQIIGTTIDYAEHIFSCDFAVGIGDNVIRQKIYNMLENHEATFATLIHPFTSISTNVKIGFGAVIMPGSSINCNVEVGNGCIINTGSCIDHDCLIGDFVHISPGSVLGGFVSVGTRTWIGLGVNVINNVCITQDCIIGAGATIVHDLVESGKYVGTPAKKLNND